MPAWTWMAVAAGALILTVNQTARADFLLVSQDMTVDQQTKTADFSLTFNQAPDFSTLDSLGRPANSFQVEFAGGFAPGKPSFPKNLTAIVRGDEIHFGNGLPIRAVSGVGGAGSGGWGPVLGTIPFQLTGDTVSFAVPLNDLGWSGNQYQAHTLSLQFGKQTAQQIVTSIPTPGAFDSGIAGLIVVGGITMMMRRRTGKSVQCTG